MYFHALTLPAVRSSSSTGAADYSRQTVVTVSPAVTNTALCGHHRLQSDGRHSTSITLTGLRALGANWSGCCNRRQRRSASKPHWLDECTNSELPCTSRTQYRNRTTGFGIANTCKFVLIASPWCVLAAYVRGFAPNQDSQVRCVLDY